MLRIMDVTGAYGFFDHGADMGIVFSGEGLEELLRNGAQALLSLLVEVKGEGPEFTRTVVLEGGEDLPIRFLNELLYLFDAERFLCRDVSLKAEGDQVRITLRGTSFDEERDCRKREVKASTYHGFSLDRRGALLTARVVLDI